MTETPPPAEASFFAAIRRWGVVRGDDGVIGGVIQGVGQRIGLAQAPSRIIAVILLIIVTGPTLLAYAAAWGLLPDSRGNIIIQNFGRGVTNVGALIGILILTIAGLGALDAPFAWTSFGPSSFPDSRLSIVLLGLIIPVAILGSLIWLVVWSINRSSSGPPTTPAPGTSAAPGEPGPDASTPSSSPPAAPAATATRAPSYVRPPYVPGPGGAGYLATLAMVLIAVAVVAWVARTSGLAVNGALAWFGVWLVGLGLVLIVVSAAGRKQGFLGVLSVPLVLLAILGTFYGDTLRDSYASLTEWSSPEPAPEYEDPWVPINPVDAFVEDYASIVMAPTCYDGPPPDMEYWEAPTRVHYATIPSDTALDVVDPVVEVSIPAGTSLVVEAIGFAQSTVYWPERDLWCDFWDGDGVNVSLLNPDEPVMTLTVFDDHSANTIIVKELP